MKMNDRIKGMIGTTVKVQHHGPDSVTGELLHLGTDFLAVRSDKDGVVYYNTQHIKSVSTPIMAGTATSSQTENTSDQAEAYFTAENFVDILRQLQYSRIKINNGPDKVEGILNGIDDDAISLVANDELIHLALFHIKTVSIWKEKNEENAETSDNDVNEKKDDQELAKNKKDANKKVEKEQN